MATTELPVMVGIFETEIEARKTLGKFLDAGFSSEQVGLAMANGSLMHPRNHDESNKTGLPEELAKNFGDAFEIGQYLVIIRHDGREQETVNLLCSNGANEYFGVTITTGLVTVSTQG